jgi:hypothetical protein
MNGNQSVPCGNADAPRSGPARGRNAEVTKSEIVRAAAQRFPARGYAHRSLLESRIARISEACLALPE